MLLRDFSGGLNIRVAPELVAPTEATVYKNIDPSSGNISSVKSPELFLSGIHKYFTYYYANSEFISRASESSFVEYKDILYSTDASLYPTKYDGTNRYRLGIVKPNAAILGISLGSGGLTGTYQYVYTYYNSLDGTESQPSNQSNEIAVANNSIIIVFNNPSSDPQVDTIRLYRIGGSLTSYTLVAELPNATVNYTDNTSDLTIAGSHILDSYDYKEAPTDLKYMTEAYAMLFGAVKDKLYYSDIALPNVWPSTNFIDFDADITGIATAQNGLLVFTKLKTYLITGNSPLTFSKYLLDASQGCLSHYSIAFVKGSVLWLSNDGICTTDGGKVEVLTIPKLGKLSLSGINNATVYDNVYYLSHSTGILCIDFRYTIIIRELDTVCNWLGVYNDTLYMQIGTDLYEAFAGAPMVYTYKSGILTEGQYTNYKTYKDFYIKYNGDINLKLYVDDTLVNSVSLSGNSCYNLKALSSAKGYGISFEITGTGIVNEIQYTVLPRQNGK